MFNVPLNKFAKLLRSVNYDNEALVEVPTKIGCGSCGAPLNCLDSIGVSTPIDHKVAPADFCNLTCLSKWLLIVRNI